MYNFPRNNTSMYRQRGGISGKQVGGGIAALIIIAAIIGGVLWYMGYFGKKKETTTTAPTTTTLAPTTTATLAPAPTAAAAATLAPTLPAPASLVSKFVDKHWGFFVPAITASAIQAMYVGPLDSTGVSAITAKSPNETRASRVRITDQGASMSITEIGTTATPLTLARSADGLGFTGRDESGNTVEFRPMTGAAYDSFVAPTMPPATTMRPATTMPVLVSAIAPTTAPPSYVIAPTTAPPSYVPNTPLRVIGNNGTVSCRRFCNGSWGKGQLASRFPGWAGADLAPGTSNSANAADGGSCLCVMSKYAPWETLDLTPNAARNTTCYGASTAVCNTCDAVVNSYVSRGWTYDKANFDQCK